MIRRKPVYLTGETIEAEYETTAAPITEVVYVVQAGGAALDFRLSNGAIVLENGKYFFRYSELPRGEYAEEWHAYNGATMIDNTGGDGFIIKPGLVGPSEA